MIDTNVTQDTSADEGKNTESTEGQDDTSTSQNNQEDKAQTKTFNQAQLDEIVKSAKRDAKAAAKRDYDKTLEGKKVFTDEELDTHVTSAVKTAVETALRERELETVKAAIKAEYGLTDVQLGRLAGDDEKALRQDADTLFGALKTKKAPTLVAGNGDTQASDKEEDAIKMALDNALSRASKRR